MPKSRKLNRVRFSWDFEYYFRTGVMTIALHVDATNTELENRQNLENDAKRFNDHQSKKHKSSAELAQEIKTAIASSTHAAPKPMQPTAIHLTMAEQQRAQDTAKTLEALAVTKRHVQRSVAQAASIVVTTNAQKLSQLSLISSEKEVDHSLKKKRFIEDAKETPAKRQLGMDSFAAVGATSFEDLVDQNTKYWARRKTTTGAKVALFRRDVVSSRHIAKVLFEAYSAPNQSPCANAMLGLCRTQLEPRLRHPCKLDAVCMHYLSPVQWEAFENDETVSVLSSPSDRLFIDPLCVFCYRYQVTREVAKDTVASSQSSIGSEIASYYHQVDIVGEYDKSACIQEHNGNVSGILGPVVAYNVAHFRPIVGIRKDGFWDMERVLSVDEYMADKDSFPADRIVFGWIETEAAFFRVNNNTLPVAAQLDAYSNAITQIKDGPLSLRLLLRNYFRHRAQAQGGKVTYEHLFVELREAVKNDRLLQLDYPVFEADNLSRLESNHQVLQPNVPASRPFERYHPWQYVCMHVATEPPPHETHRIYYAFLFLMNGIYHMKTTLQSIPLTVQRKLKVFLKAFRPMQDYFKQCTDLSDAAIRSKRLFCEALGAETSAYFAVYPRPTRLCFVVSDYEFLELTSIVVTRPAPNEELNALYQNSALPHSTELLQEAESYSELFEPLRSAQPSAYQTATERFNRLVFSLREPILLQWPSNTLTSFSVANETTIALDAMELKRRESIAMHAEALISNMENQFRELLLHLRNENAQYTALVQNLNIATAEFGEAVEWIRTVLHNDGNAVRLFSRLGVETLDHLLPSGFCTDAYGIDGQLWQTNVYLLTALVRVFVLDRLRALEQPNAQRKRYMLLLLRNSHCDLITVITERGPYVSVRNDQWLASYAVLPTQIAVWSGSGHYKPATSYLAAAWPTPTREHHEGMLPNMAASMLYANFFGDFEAKQTSFLQNLFKHRNNLRLSGSAGFHTVFSTDHLVYSLRKLNKLKQGNKLKIKGSLEINRRSDAIVTLRNLMFLMLELSLKGLYEHCDAVPNFRCTLELNTLFSNPDNVTVHDKLDTLFTTVMQNGEERLKFDKIVNDVVMEFIAAQLRCNAAVGDVVLETYRVDLTARSLALMDVVRLVLNREHTLNLQQVANVQQRLNVKLNQKVVNHRKLNNIEAICAVILESDSRRYDSVYRKSASLTVQYQITAEQIWMVECFVQHLDPRGDLFAEELQYIGLNEQSIRILSQMEDVQAGETLVNDEAVRLFESLDVHQASIVAYFFEYLQRYIRFKPVQMGNVSFLQRQKRALQKTAGGTEIPETLTTGVAALCCDRWNTFFPVKQYFWKSEDADGRKVYATTLGNQSVRKDAISEEVLCGFQPNKPTKKKDPTKFRKLQRNIEIEAGLVPTDIDQEFITVRKQYLQAQRQTNTGEVPRLTKQRRLEGRIPDCARTQVLQMNLDGIVLQCPPLRLPKQKKKDAHKRLVDEKKSQDRNRLYPPSRSFAMTVSHPPYLIAPCCARIHGYQLNNWTANGYFCGGCLPYSNNEKAIANELLCVACLSVVPNRPAFNQCLDDKCPGRKQKKRNKCRHGAQPLLMYDDMYEFRQVYQFVCDECMTPFRSTPAALLRLSSIKARDATVANKIILEH